MARSAFPSEAGFQLKKRILPHSIDLGMCQTSSFFCPFKATHKRVPSKNKNCFEFNEPEKWRVFSSSLWRFDTPAAPDSVPGEAQIGLPAIPTHTSEAELVAKVVLHTTRKTYRAFFGWFDRSLNGNPLLRVPSCQHPTNPSLGTTTRAGCSSRNCKKAKALSSNSPGRKLRGFQVVKITCWGACR